jgi:iron(III) transport system ATP-binding protein
MILDVRHIAKSFGDKRVLEDVSFQLDEGETIVITGRSGEGKSTLLKLMAGLLESDAGEIMYRGKKVPGPSASLIPGHPEIKLVNQQFDLDSYHTTAENIRLKTMHHTKEVSAEIVEELLTVTGLQHVRNHQAIQLSGGEQQRLVLARCLAEEPDVLCLDEPFVHLDPLIRRQIEQYIRKMRAQWQSSLILVTHDGREAMQWADRIVWMEDGRVKRVGSPRAFYEQPENFYQALFFGEMNQLNVGGHSRMFRPEAYQIAQKEGIVIHIQYSVFGGNYWMNFAQTADGQPLVLHANEPLTGLITIQPDYVA